MTGGDSDRAAAIELEGDRAVLVVGVLRQADRRGGRNQPRAAKNFTYSLRWRNPEQSGNDFADFLLGYVKRLVAIRPELKVIVLSALSDSQHVDAALAVLKKQPQVDPERIGVMGYCFGGGVALGMARAGKDLDAVAIVNGDIIDAVSARNALAQSGADVVPASRRKEAADEVCERINLGYLDPGTLDLEALAQEPGTTVRYDDGAPPLNGSERGVKTRAR
mgnify:CR=1 FL=1